MSKTCLNKLPGNILVSCEVPVHGISEIYLMHAEDISISIDSGGTISSVSFATGAKSYRIEGYKQNIQVTTATRSMDASNKLDISVMFKLPTFSGLLKRILPSFPKVKSSISLLV